MEVSFAFFIEGYRKQTNTRVTRGSELDFCQERDEQGSPLPESDL